MHRREGKLIAWLVAAVIAACGGQQPSNPPVSPPTMGVETSAEPHLTPTAGSPVPADGTLGPTDEPTAEPTTQSTEPLPSPEPVPPASTQPTPEPEPLPEPELQSVDEIVQVMFERSLADQVVVSMLDQLGIGLYDVDGTPIRTGTETSDTDLFLYEPEARGLIEMLRAQDFEEDWIPFRDFHAALSDLGFTGSVEELAAAYTSAYDSNTDAPVAQLVYGLGGVDVETPINPLAAWLLFVDGFVTPNNGGAALALGAGGLPVVAQGDRRGWGVSRDEVQALVTMPLEADPLVIAHLISVVASSSVVVTTTASRVHEGHGGPGTPTTITATVRAVASTFVSPFSQRPLIPVNPVPGAGVLINWTTDAALNAHGTTSTRPTVTDPLGQATFTYTPRQEDANGEGYLTREFSTIQASVSGAELITKLYGMPSLGALVGNEVRGLANVEIEWHEPEAMRVSLVNNYDVTLDLLIAEGHATGTDSFEGILALQDDGTWRGVVTGNATGSHQGHAFGEPCSSSWSATQQVEVLGAAAPYALNGDFYFRFYPVTQPSGNTGGGTCPPSVASYEGVDYAPYNDASISDVERNQGLVIYLPAKPGGARDYPIKLQGVVDANWHVEIEYLEPQ